MKMNKDLFKLFDTTWKTWHAIDAGTNYEKLSPFQRHHWVSLAQELARLNKKYGKKTK